MKKTITSIISFLCLLTSLQAVEVKLSSLKNDDDHKSYDLYLSYNEEGEALALKLWDIMDQEWTNYKIDHLSSGVVLKRVKKKDVIILRSQDFDIYQGGELKLDYLYNALTGERRSLNLSLEFNGEEWTLFYEGKVVNHLSFFVNKSPFGTLGIKRVVVKGF